MLGEELALAHYLGIKLVDVEDDAVLGVGAADDEKIDVLGELAVGRLFEIAEEQGIDLPVRIGLEQGQVRLFRQGLKIDVVELGRHLALMYLDAPLAGGAVMSRQRRGDDPLRLAGEAVLLPILFKGPLFDLQLGRIVERQEGGGFMAAEVLRQAAVEIKTAGDREGGGVIANGHCYSLI